MELSTDGGISNCSGQIISSKPHVFRKSLDLVITQNLHLFKSLWGGGGVGCLRKGIGTEGFEPKEPRRGKPGHYTHCAAHTAPCPLPLLRGLEE